jgi:hypothetical protein
MEVVYRPLATCSNASFKQTRGQRDVFFPWPAVKRWPVAEEPSLHATYRLGGDDLRVAQLCVAIHLYLCLKPLSLYGANRLPRNTERSFAAVVGVALGLLSLLPGSKGPKTCILAVIGILTGAVWFFVIWILFAAGWRIPMGPR